MSRLFGQRDDRAQEALYAEVVRLGREPHWYVEGGVPDTLDGRFDAIAAVLAAVLVRLEAEPGGVRGSTRLAERFIDDMDAQLRQIGIGDLVVGKQVGRAVSMLGGRLGAYRDGLNGYDPRDPRPLDDALVRNLYRGEPPAREALLHTREALVSLKRGLESLPVDTVLAGRLS